MRQKTQELLLYLKTSLFETGGFFLIGFVLGISGILLALNADLIGIGGKSGLGSKQIALLISSAVAAGGLLVYDTAWGKRTLWDWIRRDILDLEKLGRILTIAFQLWLLSLLITQFDIESDVFQSRLVPLILGGFVVHALLPESLRLSFFSLFSLVGIVAMLGPVNGLWLISIGLLLIGIVYLPVSYRIRLWLILIAGGTLTFVRSAWAAPPWTGNLWPFIGSFFFLRTLIFLYDLRTAKSKPSIWLTLSYFFILPNAVFILFPPIDFSNYRRGYYKGDAFQTYQKGIGWILWGVIHLLIYRVVNYYFTLAAGDVNSFATLSQYILSTYLLYLRVIGQARIALGILHLFGFNLPQPFNVHFLAISFTDFWRRANIYWKDLMQKVFFYPMYFRWKHKNIVLALTAATMLNFIVAWLLHAYQWYWIRGDFLLSTTDILFWTILGLSVVINVLGENRKGTVSMEKQAQSFRGLLLYSLRATIFFSFMVLLWSMWTSSTLAEWFSLFRVSQLRFASILQLIGLLISIWIVFSIATWYETHGKRRLAALLPNSGAVSFYSLAGVTALFTILLFAAGHPMILEKTGGAVEVTMLDLRRSRLSTRDSNLLTHGYYEEIMGSEQMNSEVWEVMLNRPTDWEAIIQSAATRLTHDFQNYELVPSVSVEFNDSLLVTNQWGMRDDDYTLRKPPHTFRLAIMGGSRTMGTGVENHQKFEYLVEKRLNDTYDGTDLTYELLDFSVGGYGILPKLLLLNDVMAFEPDVLLLIPHPDSELLWAREFLYARVQEGVPIPFNFLQDIIRKSGLDASMTYVEAMNALEPFSEEIVRESYVYIIAECKKFNVLPVWFTFENLNDSVSNPENLAIIHRLAIETGFTIIDLSNVYDGWEPASLYVAPWDFHPNPQGHRIIAEKLYEYLTSHDEIFLGK